MTPKDKGYLLMSLLCLCWFALISASGCDFSDAPFGFVRGCYNQGVNWNAIIAPSGVLVVLALPVCVMYWLYRLLQLLVLAIGYSWRKLTTARRG